MCIKTCPTVYECGVYGYRWIAMRSLDLERAYQEERRADIMRAAARRRLVQEVSAAQPEPSPERFYSSLLVHLGCVLTGWGVRLQARYGAGC